MGGRKERKERKKELKRQSKELRKGRTIAAEREPVETESERMQARRKVHRRKTSALVIVLLLAMILGLGAYLGMEELSREREAIRGEQEKEEVKIQAQIVDEDNRGEISRRVREYIAQLEGDFRDLGFRVKKVTLPKGMSRELFVDLEGKDGLYFKVSIDRETAVSAEDAVRMLTYLEEHDLHPGYVDVRLAEKAYYK